MLFPFHIAIGYYFETKRSLASGITRVGGGLGQFVYAPLATFLINKYDWRVTIFIVAGISLFCAIFAVLMRPLELKEDEEIEAAISQPSPLSMKGWGSKKESKRTISVFSRKDSIYTISVQGLMEANKSASSTWADFRHLLLSTPR